MKKPIRFLLPFQFAILSLFLFIGLAKAGGANDVSAAFLYAHPDGVSCSNTPCYDSIQDAINDAAAGDTIFVEGSFTGLFSESVVIGKDLTIDGSGYAGTIQAQAVGGRTIRVNSGIVVIQDINLIGNTNRVIRSEGGTTTVRCSNLDANGKTVFRVGGGALIAYGNNITNFADDLSISVPTTSYNGRHNWWGAAVPANVGNSEANNYRLGADVVDCAIGALGDASISGGTTGEGIIISHGRGLANVPFGQGVAGEADTQCAEYYDFFAAPTTDGTDPSGDWTVDIPIDDDVDCDPVFTNTLATHFRLGGGGAPNLICANGLILDGGCWTDLTSGGAETVASIPGSPRLIRWSTASTTDLGGTPVTLGNRNGQDPDGANDPTAVNLVNLGAGSSQLVLPMALFAFVILLFAIRYFKSRIGSKRIRE